MNGICPPFIVHRSSFILHRFYEILNGQHRPMLHLLFGCVDRRAQCGIVRDCERFLQREVFVVRDERRDRPATARENRALAGQLTRADEPADVFRKIEDFERFFHCRRFL